VKRKSKRQSATPVVFEPPIERWPAAGVYQLWLRVSVASRLTIGRLGRFTFPAGRYVYTGRASRGLRARVLRHARGAHRKHWHIDYLLARREVRLERVRLASSDPDDECAINRALSAEGAAVAPGFGASDCRSHCPTHLWRIRRHESKSRILPVD
jgi:Uri superfamily endonuclease